MRGLLRDSELRGDLRPAGAGSPRERDGLELDAIHLSTGVDDVLQRFAPRQQSLVVTLHDRIVALGRAHRQMPLQDMSARRVSVYCQGQSLAVDADVNDGTLTAVSRERQWWLRVLAVFLDPKPVFVALREDAKEDQEARLEPLLLIVLLAGIAGVLATPRFGRLFDDPAIDGPALISVVVFFAGGFYAFAGYFGLGGAVYLGARGLGSLGTYRRSRQVLGFACVPLAASIVLLPLRLALFGGDAFASGGSDDGTAGTVVAVVQLAFVAWTVGLLLLGVRAVHGWTWARAAAALGLVAAVLALAALLPAAF